MMTGPASRARELLDYRVKYDEGAGFCLDCAARELQKRASDNSSQTETDIDEGGEI